MIVSSPRLYKDYDFLVLGVRPHRPITCLGALEDYIDIPDSTSYWLEASDQQWPDRSGLRVKVKIGHYTPWYASDVTRGRWNELCSALRYYLRKLGCVSEGPPKVIYFRLLYKE